MYSRELIQTIHRDLQALDPSALVLLGGSYLHGEATENSDVDFYFIISSLQLLGYSYYKKLLTDFKKRYPNVRLAIMLIPKVFFRRGWYFICGEDIEGKKYASPIRKKFIFRNALKLSLFYYICSLRSQERSAMQNMLVKAAHQLGITLLVCAEEDIDQPSFSVREIVAYLKQTGEAESIQILLQTKLTGETLAKHQCETLRQTIFREASAVIVQQKSLFTFSLVNYLIYNLKFLTHGNPLFLFKNPDKMIVWKIIKGIEKKDDLKNFQKEIKQIIFPVIIF